MGQRACEVVEGGEEEWEGGGELRDFACEDLLEVKLVCRQTATAASPSPPPALPSAPAPESSPSPARTPPLAATGFTPVVAAAGTSAGSAYNMEAAVRSQLEFYFSDSNLSRDSFMREQISARPDGCVPQLS